MMVRVVVCIVLLAGVASAADAASKPPVSAASNDAVASVTLGFHIMDVRNVDLRAQSFFADFYMWMRYPGVTQNADFEKIEFMNGKLDAQPKDAEIDRKTVNGQTYMCWRLSGTFYFEPQLRNYPFDTQDLNIVIEHPSLETDKLRYADDEASYARSGGPRSLYGVKQDLDIPDFTLQSATRQSLDSVYKTDFGDPEREQATSKYSRFVFSMHFSRDFLPYFFKIIIPLLVIIAMAYLVFLLPPKEIQSATGLAITALLSCIAFGMTVSQGLPEVGYLVVSDKFFICTDVLLFLTLLQSVMAYGWQDRGAVEFAERWLKVCRVVFPVLYVGGFSYLLINSMLSS